MATARTRGRGDPDLGSAAPASDVYTGLLIISLLAMIIGCILLYLDYSEYPTSKAPTPPPVTAPSRAPEAAPIDPAAAPKAP